MQHVPALQCLSLWFADQSTELLFICTACSMEEVFRKAFHYICFKVFTYSDCIQVAECISIQCITAVQLFSIQYLLQCISILPSSACGLWHSLGSQGEYVPYWYTRLLAFRSSLPSLVPYYYKFLLWVATRGRERIKYCLSSLGSDSKSCTNHVLLDSV